MSTIQHNNSREMSYEFSLIRDQLATVNPAAAGRVDSIVNDFNRSINADDSDEETVLWPREHRFRRSRAAEIDLMEGDRSDSDSEPNSAATSPTFFGHRAHRRRAAAEQFREGNRRTQQPSGRGWENTALIAAGAEPPRRIYGDSMDAIRDTSLVEPELAPSSPPQSRAELRRLNAIAEQHVDRLMRLEDEEDAARDVMRQRRRVAQTNAAEDALNAHRRTGNCQRLTQELFRRAQRFSDDDPAAFAQWYAFVTIARRCSNSVARRLQIMQWYTRRPRGNQGGSVPRRLLRQLRRLELWHTHDARLERRFCAAEMQDGSRPMVDVQEWIANDDNAWSANSRHYTFGYEFGMAENGFADYQPRGEGPALLNHLEANMEARVMRLYHANPEDLEELMNRMRCFCARAISVLNGQRSALRRYGPENSANLDRVEWHLSRYRSTRFHVQEGNGEAGDDDESDASDVIPIRTGIPASAARNAVQ